jgi:hypothetical protein
MLAAMTGPDAAGLGETVLRLGDEVQAKASSGI